MARLSLYKGQNNLQKIKIIVYQTIIVIIAVVMLQLVFLLNIVRFAQLLNIKQEVIQYLEVYSIYAFSGSIVYSFYDLVRQYLLVYGYNQIGIQVMSISMGFQILLGFQLSSYGLHGLGVTYLSGQVINLVLIIVYMIYRLNDQIPPLPQLSQLSDGFGEYLVYIFKISFITYADFLSYNLMTMMASQLTEQQFAAHLFLSQYYSITCTMSVGLQCILNNQLNYYFGQQNYEQLLKIIKSVLYYHLLAIIVIFILLNSQYWVYIYTYDQPTISEIYSTIPYTSLLLVTDQFALVFAGILKGIQLENMGVLSYLIGYYVYGMPVILLYFKPRMQLQGIWLGWGSSTFIIAFLQYFYMNKSMQSFSKKSIYILSGMQSNHSEKLMDNKDIELQNINNSYHY